MTHAKFHRLWLAAVCAASSTASAEPTAIARDSDVALDCRAIRIERHRLDEVIAAGGNTPGIGRAVAGGAANVGGQVAGAAVAQSTGILGSLGGLFSKAVGVVAQQQVEERMAPDAQAVEQARQAQARSDFLAKLAEAKACRDDDDSFAGKPLSQAEFAALRVGPAAGVIQPFAAGAVGQALAQPVTPVALALPFEGDIKLAGKRFYLAEFRVLFEVAGEVSASTRAGRLPGVNYGATHSRIKYQVPQVDVAALQALTDKAYADLLSRLQAAGVTLEPADGFIAQHGAVYPATEPASTADAPVFEEVNLGHTRRKYMVFAPTGMKLHARGIAGLGAGDIGARIAYVKNGLEGLSIGVALNVAALESSGSGSSILHQDGANTSARPAMSLAAPAGSTIAQGHAAAGALRLSKPVVIPGTFAVMRETGGYDTQKDAAVRGVQLLSNLMGVAASKSKTVEMALELDGPSTSRLALQALSGFNQSLVDQLKAGL